MFITKCLIFYVGLKDPKNKVADEPGVVQFTVRRNGSIELPVSVMYRTIQGSAIENEVCNINTF